MGFYNTKSKSLHFTKTVDIRNFILLVCHSAVLFVHDPYPCGRFTNLLISVLTSVSMPIMEVNSGFSPVFSNGV